MITIDASDVAIVAGSALLLGGLVRAGRKRSAKLSHDPFWVRGTAGIALLAAVLGLWAGMWQGDRRVADAEKTHVAAVAHLQDADAKAKSDAAEIQWQSNNRNDAVDRANVATLRGNAAALAAYLHGDDTASRWLGPDTQFACDGPTGRAHGRCVVVVTYDRSTYLSWPTMRPQWAKAIGIPEGFCDEEQRSRNKQTVAECIQTALP